jgi:hypothetical protein
MGNNSSSNLKKAANENVSYSGASNGINQFNGILEMEQNKEKRDLNFTIISTMSSISVTKENIAEFTRKLTIEQERLQKLEAKLTDAKAKLEFFNSSSNGGTRKKTLNKNNRKTRTLCKNNNNI